MNRSWVRLCVPIAAAILFPAAAFAGNSVCFPCSTQPAGLVLVGQAGQPDPVGTITYTVYDLMSAPLAFRHVTIHFDGCSDLALCGNVAAPGSTIDCGAKQVVGVTDLYGRVSFTIVGHGTGGAPRTLGPCATVDLEGHPLDALRVSAYDLDGTRGIDGIDLGIFASDAFNQPTAPRSDYDFDGDVDGLDLGLLARALFGGGSTASGAACP